jgi:hypothetical protein
MDTAGYTKLETGQLKNVQDFLTQNVERLETAELTLRRSAGTFVVVLRPTDEATS